MKQNKINIAQVGVLAFFLSKVSFVGIGTYAIIHTSDNMATISALIGVIIGAIILLIFNYVSKYLYKYDIIKLNKEIFPSFIAHILNFLLLLATFLIGIIISWVLIKYINTQFLSFTINSFLAMLFIIPVIFLGCKGLETAARTGQILFIVYVGLFIVSLLGLIPQTDFKNLLPFMDNGIFPVMKGGYIFGIFSSIPIFFLTVIPKNEIKGWKNYSKFIYLFYFISAISLVLVLFYTTSVFGINIAKLFQYPEYFVLKQISFFEFIERIENILAMQWLIDIVIVLFILCYFIYKYMAGNFKKLHTTNSQNIITTISIITMTLIANYYFDRALVVKDIIIQNLPYILTFLVLLPFTITAIRLKTLSIIKKNNLL